VIEVRDLSHSFSGRPALRGVSFDARPGELLAVIGPNGAGKTTLLNVVSGFVTPTTGRIEFDGRDITSVRAHRRVPLGIVRTFQNIRLYAGLSVLDNVLVGQHGHARSGPTSVWPVRTAGERALRADADRLLEMFQLTGYRNRRAGEIPYGSQKQLEMARALAARPRVLLLDEPAAGMTAGDRAALVPRIRSLRDDGLTVVIIEHDMEVISKVCDTVTVLNFGRQLVAGPPDEALASPQVRTAYLGT
jgi:ABC-type branched-subunit amino acid transport system ATPase component